MNFYPFHIGDYLSATRHLSWEEDAAYRRLLDVYYMTERPLPADLRQVWRLVLAHTDSQREAVKAVLAEFFTATDAGWVSRRASAEIGVMRDKQQKQRDRAKLRWHGPNADLGDVPELPLNDAVASIGDATASFCDANAMPPIPIPIPIPIPTPTPTPGLAPGEGKAPPAGACPLASVPADLKADWLQVRKDKRAGRLTASAIKGLVREAGKAGISVAEAVAACCEFSWIGFNAGWYADRLASRSPRGGTDWQTGRPFGRQASRQPPPEPAWRTEQKSLIAQHFPTIAARPAPPPFIDLENPDATAPRLD